MIWMQELQMEQEGATIAKILCTLLFKLPSDPEVSFRVTISMIRSD